MGAVDRKPLRIARKRRIEVARDEREVGGSNGARARISLDVTSRFQLFEVGNVSEVHLRREVATQRRAEAFDVTERPTRQSPCAFERLAGPSPEQRVQACVAHLEHHREDFVSEATRVLIW